MDKSKSLFKVIIFLIVVIVMVLFVRSYLSDEKTYEVDTKGGYTETETPVEKKRCNVDISGEVINPGVYSLDSDSIVDDAIALAGGLTHMADTESINRSQKIYDGMKIIVPKNKDNSLKETYEGILEWDIR